MTVSDGRMNFRHIYNMRQPQPSVPIFAADIAIAFSQYHITPDITRVIHIHIANMNDLAVIVAAQLIIIQHIH